MERDNPTIVWSLVTDVLTDARPPLVGERMVGKIGEGIYDAELGRLRPMEATPTLPATLSSVVSERRIL